MAVAAAMVAAAISPKLNILKLSKLKLSKGGATLCSEEVVETTVVFG